MPSVAFFDFLNEISTKPLRVLNPSIPNSKYTPINLSFNNVELHDVDVGSVSSLENFISAHIKRHQALVAFGGYNETRALYKQSIHFNHDPTTERNIHLGVDLWIKANANIYAPLDGIVHSFNNNNNFGDYGPTIILEHKINDVQFYTLYGHLSLESIENLKVGQYFKQGQAIGNLGDASVNGDYPPHLHFQIIKDLQEYFGDYPGVCNVKDLAFYLNNCPDPESLLKLSI